MKNVEEVFIFILLVFWQVVMCGNFKTSEPFRDGFFKRLKSIMF